MEVKEQLVKTEEQLMEIKNYSKIEALSRFLIAILLNRFPFITDLVAWVSIAELQGKPLK